MIHDLKIDPVYLENLKSGIKKSEIRYNDRDYQLGDILEFWDNEENKDIFFEITHIHSGLGMKDGYVVLSISIKENL